jgi:hypothetical protein
MTLLFTLISSVSTGRHMPTSAMILSTSAIALSQACVIFQYSAICLSQSKVGVPIVAQVAVKFSQPDRPAVRVTNALESCTYVTHPPPVVVVTLLLLFLLSKVFRHVPYILPFMHAREPFVFKLAHSAPKVSIPVFSARNNRVL